VKDPPPHDNLVQLFEASVQRFADRRLFGVRAGDGSYSWVSYGETGARVDRLRAGLAAAGIGPGDVVGLIANNRVEWATVAFASYGRRARLVPMYEAELEATWRCIVEDSGVKLLFVADAEQMERLRPWVGEIPTLERLVCLEGQGTDSLAGLVRQGASAPQPSLQPEPGDVALLIYTSGTTAEPKGVLLSHGNLSSNAWAGYRCFPELGPHGVSLSILPWAHSYGQTAELNCFLQFGGSLAFMGSVETLSQDLLTVRPTYLLAVPRILNRIHDGVQEQLQQRGGLALALFRMGLSAAHERQLAIDQGQGHAWASARLLLADRIVFRKIRARLGGRVEGVVSGSATLNPEITRFFHYIGMPVFDCYGLTETSPAVTMNSSTGFKPGSVGRPIDGVRVVIDRSVVEEDSEDGEIVVYGPNVMLGYHNKPEQTAAVLTADGGFRTGDRGRLDGEGFLFVTGRIKEQYKLENGKYVFPASLEEHIRREAGVANAVVYGAGRPYNVCLLVPDLPALQRWAAEQGIEGTGQALLDDPTLLTSFGQALERSLRQRYGGYEVPRRWAWLQQDLSVEDGTLTQTMKLRRRLVYERYAQRIEALYSQD